MTPALEQLKGRYLALEPRERLLVTTGAAVLAVVMYYLLVWEPLAKAREQATTQIAAEQALAAELAAATPLARQALGRSSAGAAPISAQNRSLLAVVDQTGKAAGLGQGVRRVQPEGDDRVRIWLEGVEFNRTVRWLHQLETRHGMVVDSADMGAQSAPGQVEARLGLARQ